VLRADYDAQHGPGPDRLPGIQWAPGFAAYEARNASSHGPVTLRREAMEVVLRMPCSRCFPSEPLRCMGGSWDGHRKCEHVNIYAKRPRALRSYRACSRLVGHTLSLMRLLEGISVQFADTPGVVVFVEDDIDMSPRDWQDKLGYVRNIM